MSIEELLQTAELGETADTVNFTSAAEEKASIDAMAAQARRDIKILVQDFSSDLITRQDLLLVFSQFCRISRFSSLKILVVNSNQAATRASQLIELSRKYSSSISMKKLSKEHRELSENFFIADNIGIVYQPNHLVAAGNTDFKSSIAKQKAKWFDDAFERSQVDPYFRQYNL